MFAHVSRHGFLDSNRLKPQWAAGGLGVHRLLTMSSSRPFWDSWDSPDEQQPQQHGQQAGGQQGQQQLQQPQQYGQQAWQQYGQQAWGQTGQQQLQQPQQHVQQACGGWWPPSQVQLAPAYFIYPMHAQAPQVEGKGLSSSPVWGGGGSSMGHGQDRDKGHEQGKSNNSPEKGQDKGQEKKGKGKGKAKKGKGQEQAKGKSRGSSKGKGLSPSPWTGGGEEAKGDKKDQKAKGEGKAPKTAEQVKQHTKQRREKWTTTERANTNKDLQGYRVPYYHRRQRVPPGKLRSITDKLVPLWKKKRVKEGALYSKYKWNFMTGPRDGQEAKFQQQVKQMRAEITRVFSHILPNPRIIEDISGEGAHRFRDTPLWTDGVTWNDTPIFGKPEDPCTDRTKVWDLWLTDYNPRWHKHLFGDCPLNSGKEEVKEEEGQGTSSRSTGTGKDLCPSLTQKTSWFSYHGTSITSAIVALCLNSLNKSERVFGDPAPNDDKHPRAGQEAKAYGDGTYEATVQRGIYTSTSWKKALSYASPYVVLPEKDVWQKGKTPEIQAQIVLLVRTPGSLEKVGIALQVGAAGKNRGTIKWTWKGNHWMWDPIGPLSTWTRGWIG